MGALKEKKGEKKEEKGKNTEDGLNVWKLPPHGTEHTEYGSHAPWMTLTLSDLLENRGFEALARIIAEVR